MWSVRRAHLPLPSTSVVAANILEGLISRSYYRHQGRHPRQWDIFVSIEALLVRFESEDIGTYIRRTLSQLLYLSKGQGKLPPAR